MPLFTGTPIQIAGTPFLWTPDFGGFMGRFFFGSIMVEAGYKETTGAAIVSISTDGVTWTQYSQAGTDFSSGDLFVRAAKDGSLLRFISKTGATGHLLTFTFDPTTPAFSATVDSGIVVGNAVSLCVRPNGDVRAFYTTPTSPHSVKWIAITAGAFGSGGFLDTATGAENLEVYSTTADSSNVIHVGYVKQNGTQQVLYNTLSASDVAGTRQVVDGSGTFSTYLLSNIVISTGMNQILIAMPFEDPVQVFVGTPISAPAWTPKPVHTIPAGFHDGEIILVDAGATIKVLYSTLHNAATKVLQIMEVDWDGSAMGAPQVYWDVLANRVAGAVGVPAASIFTDGITADLTGGVLGVCVLTQINGSPNFDSSGVYTSISISTNTQKNRFSMGYSAYAGIA